MPRFRATTILAVRHHGKAAIGGDGQVTLGPVVMKSDAHKIRKLYDGKVLVGFAGAATELAKDWRTDRVLRRLEAMMIALDKDSLLLIGGTGDVIQPTDGVLAIGSGGSYALAAARALMAHSTLTAAEIVKAAMEVAGDICIYTNRNIDVVEVGAA